MSSSHEAIRDGLSIAVARPFSGPHGIGQVNAAIGPGPTIYDVRRTNWVTRSPQKVTRFILGLFVHPKSMQKRQPLAEKDFVRVLFNKGFDKRFFNPSNYGKSKLEDLKISGKELYRAIKGAEISGNMPDTCVGSTSGTSVPCKVTVSEKSVSYQNFQLPGYNLRLTVQNEKPVDIFFYPSDEADLSASDDDDGGVVYTYVIVDWSSKVQIGDRIYSGFILFEKQVASQSALVLKSIILKPGIIVSIDKKRDPVCLVTAPNVVNMLDDGILVTHKNSKTNLVEGQYSATPPFAACSADNVVE